MPHEVPRCTQLSGARYPSLLHARTCSMRGVTQGFLARKPLQRSLASFWARSDSKPRAAGCARLAPSVERPRPVISRACLGAAAKESEAGRRPQPQVAPAVVRVLEPRPPPAAATWDSILYGDTLTAALICSGAQQQRMQRSRFRGPASSPQHSGSTTP